LAGLWAENVEAKKLSSRVCSVAGILVDLPIATKDLEPVLSRRDRVWSIEFDSRAWCEFGPAKLRRQ
jgi:hypothetical protein